MLRNFLHNSVYIPTCNGSLVIAHKLKARCVFHLDTILIFYILPQQKLRNFRRHTATHNFRTGALPPTTEVRATSILVLFIEGIKKYNGGIQSNGMMLI
jgi:hypothetical protein